jgi:hypothetical protein
VLLMAEQLLDLDDLADEMSVGEQIRNICRLQEVAHLWRKNRGRARISLFPANRVRA